MKSRQRRQKGKPGETKVCQQWCQILLISFLQDFFGVGRKVAVEIIRNASGDHLNSPFDGASVMVSLPQMFDAMIPRRSL